MTRTRRRRIKLPDRIPESCRPELDGPVCAHHSGQQTEKQAGYNVLVGQPNMQTNTSE